MRVDQISFTIEEIVNYIYNGSRVEKLKIMDYIWTKKVTDEKVINGIRYLANKETETSLACAYKIWHIASALLFLLTNEHSELYKTKGEFDRHLIDRLIPEADGVFKF